MKKHQKNNGDKKAKEPQVPYVKKVKIRIFNSFEEENAATHKLWSEQKPEDLVAQTVSFIRTVFRQNKEKISSRKIRIIRYE